MSSVSPSGVMNMSLQRALRSKSQVFEGVDHLGLALDDFGDELAQAEFAADLDLRLEHGRADAAAAKFLGQEHANFGHVAGVAAAQVQRGIADDAIADHRDQREDLA